MKKINSINYGGKILGTAAVLLLLIPAAMKLVSRRADCVVLHLLGEISFLCGLFVLQFFSILLIIEFHQDKKINKYYEDNKNMRLIFNNGLFECQSCGNRQVKPEDKNCSICGIYFKG